MEVVNIACFLKVRKENQESNAGLLESLQPLSHFNPSVSPSASPSATNGSLSRWVAGAGGWSGAAALPPSAGAEAGAPQAELLRHVYWQLLWGRHKVF